MKKKRMTTITFKGSAANRIFAQIAADVKGPDATKGMVEGTELHRMTIEEVEKKKAAETEQSPGDGTVPVPS